MNKKAKNSPFTTNNPLENTQNYISGNEITITEARALLPENLKHLNLNPREYKFLALYCSNNFNAEEAVKNAGYKERNRAGYKAIAYSLLQRKEIVSGIRTYIDTIIEPYKERLELEILNIYYRRAFYNINTFYDSKLNPLPLSKINKDFLCCIDDIKYIKVSNNSTIPAYVLPNRDLALQALYKFVTGQDLNSNTVLPEESKKKIQNIYNTIIAKEVKPQQVKKINKEKKLNETN